MDVEPVAAGFRALARLQLSRRVGRAAERRRQSDAAMIRTFVFTLATIALGAAVTLAFSVMALPAPF
jgi:hypothetical protein